MTPSWTDFIAGWELFRDPILCGLVAGAALGMLGVFIVLRRMVFISAALSQAAGLGVALSFFAQIHLGLAGFLVDPRLGALLMTFIAAGMLRLEPRGRLTREGMLGLAYLVASAGTLMVGTRISQEAHDIQAILFGTGVLVRPSDTAWVLGSAALVFAMVLWWRRGLIFASFDPDGAKVRGLPTALLSFAILGAIALMVSIATRALGALPVFAFSILPAIAAIALAPSPTGALLLAGSIGALAGVGGYMLAFFGQFPVGASQTLVSAILAAAAWGIRMGLSPRSASRLSVPRT
ncbi:High-affinity zinc uptake system membrane protein ZnuB [compost metagenome]